MKIERAVVNKEVLYKIYQKHGVKFTEAEEVLLGKPYVSKTKLERFVAIGKSGRYITVIFLVENNVAEIITAYPSSNWQIKLYKNKKEK